MQGIEFQIVNDSSQASAGLDALTKSLENFKSKLGNTGPVLNKIASGISAIDNTLKRLNASDFEGKMEKIAKSIENLGSKTASIKLSSSIGKQLSGIGTAIDGIDWTDGDKLSLLATGLRPLGELNPAKLTSFINQLGKMPEVITELEKANVDKFSDQMKRLADAMRPFADEMNKVSAGFSAFPSRIQRLIKSTEEYNGVVKRATHRTNSFRDAIKALSFYKLAKIVAGIIHDSSEWEGVSARFGRAFGEYAEENYSWIKRLNEEMHINVQQFMQYSSIYGTMLKGFGVAQKDAATMAIGYTELAYDIWAGYQDIYKTFEDAAMAVRSAIAGETEPIQKAGFTIVDSQLKITAANHGVAYSTQSATQELKSYLRYLTLVDQAATQNLIGTYASEMNTAEGLLRTLSQQVRSLAQTIGSVFLPILSKTLPWIQAIVSLINDAVIAIASFFGVTLQKVDFDNSFGNAVGATGEIADGMDSAAGSAKELKRYLAGFDELNVLPDQKSGGGAGGGIGGGAGGGAFDVEKLWDENIFKKINKQAEELKEKLKPILTVATAIGAVIAGWKLSTEFVAAIKALSAWKAITLGLTLSVSGFFVEFAGIKDAIQNGLKGFNFGEIVAGGLLGTAGTSILGMGIGKFIAKAFAGSAVAKAITAGGGAISTGLIGAAIGGIVAGIPMFVTGVYDAFKNGLNWLNGLLIPLGSTMAGASIGAIIGSFVGPIGTGIGALVGLAVGAVTDFGIFLYEKWDEISAFFSKTFGGLAAWFDERVIQPVKKVFAPIGEWISKVFEGSWIIIQAVWQVASEWFNTKIAEPLISVFNTVKDKVSGFFQEMWNNAVSVWNIAYGWFTTNVTEPLSNAFCIAWESITNGFSSVKNGVVSIAKGMFNGVVSIFESMINSVIDGLNWLIKQFNNLVSWGAGIIGVSWSGISQIGSVSLPKFADGGFPSAGELFIAREAGPEMVGSIGGRTAVANNDQIVEGITHGVRDANDDVVTAIYAVAQQIIAEMRSENRSGSGKSDIAAYLAEQQRRRARALGL